MATQRTANTHLLARDGSSSHPGHGHLAPAWGLSSLPAVSRVPGLCLPGAAPRRSSSTASGLRGSVALADSGLVTGLSIKSCPPVPPAQLRLSRVSRALHAASVAPPPPGDAPGPSAPSAPASEAPCAAEAASNSDDDWDALLDAHGLAPPPGGAAAAVAQPAHAAGGSRRARDKRSRRLRKAAKRSMWREIRCSARFRLVWRPAAALCASPSMLGFFFSGDARLISGVCCVFSRPCSVVRVCP